jgi:hypothetical protein
VCRRYKRRFKKLNRNFCVSSTEDEGRPFGIGFQEQVSNHLKRLLLRVMVVSVEEKPEKKTGR